MPYFDPFPKHRREDLYDREGELRSLIGLIEKGSPLILLLGLRRSGKTSLLLTALNEWGGPSFILDLRELYGRGSAASFDFTRILERGLNELLRGSAGIRDRLLEALGRFKGIKAMGFGLEFRRAMRERDLGELLASFNDVAIERGERIVIAFDEAQELRKVAGLRFDALLAHIYDYLRGLTVILTGSQIGLLHRFLRIGDPGAPLYGRAIDAITLGNFTEEQSIGFLTEGFKQYGVEVGEDYIRRATASLDGVVGWLAMLGHKTVESGSVEEGTIEAVLEEASELALEELDHFLRLRAIARGRYETVLRAAAGLGDASWSDMKLALQAREGREINDRNFAAILKNLLDSGFLIKDGGRYRIPDPILRYALRRRS